jgi:hypothetical protein
MLNPKSSCVIQRELQAAYLTAAERVGVAQLEFADFLTIGRVGAGSKALLEELREECSVARVRLTAHRHQHHC